MSHIGNQPDKYIYEYIGDPTGVSIRVINPPRGAMVINRLTGARYRKTSQLNDNSGYVLEIAGSSAIISNTIFVDENGGSGSGWDGSIGAPFDTLIEARDDAGDNDTIAVNPKFFYNENNLGKTGVLVHWVLGPGVNITYTGSGVGIFDDGASGTNADIRATVRGQGTITCTVVDSVIHTVRPGSELTIEADTVGGFDAPIAFFTEKGYLSLKCRQLISKAVTAYWFGGNGNIEVQQIYQTEPDLLAVNAAIACMPNVPDSIWYLNAQLAQGVNTGLYFTSADASNRFWCVVTHIVGGKTGGVFVEGTGGVCYVFCQKTECASDGTGEVPAICVTGSTLHWLGQKVEGGAADGTSGCILIAGGLAYIDILDELVDTGMAGSPGISVSGGEAEISVNRFKRITNGHGVEVTSGSLRLSNSRIDTSSFTGKSALRGTSGTTVILRNCHLQVHAAADSIASMDGSTFTVICLGGVTSNRDPGANVTIIGAMEVNAAFQ